MINRFMSTALLALSIGMLAAGCGGEQPQQQPGDVNVVLPAGSSPPVAVPVPADPGGEAAPQPAPASDAPAGKPAPPAKKGAPRVVIDTSMGEIELELDPAKAPVTTANFLKYVKNGHYSGTIFHRVIADFMIQGGGFTPGMEEKPTGEGIKNEGKNGLKNRRGTVAMARTSDPDSASAQFFINVEDNSGLDYPEPDGFGYAVFGKVVRGMDVVDKIRAVPTTLQAGMQDVPEKPVLIRSMKVK